MPSAPRCEPVRRQSAFKEKIVTPCVSTSYGSNMKLAAAYRQCAATNVLHSTHRAGYVRCSIHQHLT